MVSTSIPTLSIAAISSAKAQTHTEYYNTKHGKIAYQLHLHHEIRTTRRGEVGMWATSRGWTRCARAAHMARRSSRAVSGFKTLDAPLDTALAGKVLERLPSASAARK